MTRERWRQPGLCQCQPSKDVWHAHYYEGNHACARCGCREWRPSIKPLISAIQIVKQAQQNLSEAENSVVEAWMQLGRIIESPVGQYTYNKLAMEKAEAAVTEAAIREFEYEAKYG